MVDEEGCEWVGGGCWDIVELTKNASLVKMKNIEHFLFDVFNS